MLNDKEERSVLESNRTYNNDFFGKVYEDMDRVKDTIELFSKKKASTIKLAMVKPVLLGNKKNDFSCIADDIFYYMKEAQSTPNPNMPFRFLQYISTGLLNFVETNDLYGKNLVKLKVPKLYTAFTGLCQQAPQAIIGEQRLSDAYEVLQEHPDLEVVVHTYDFNMTAAEVETYLKSNKTPDRFKEFTQSSLFWYAMFCNSVKYQYRDIKPGREDEKVQALYRLCELFRDREIFVDLFNDMEVVNMTVMEFSKENEIKYAGIEEGMELGIEQGIAGSIELLAEVGFSKQQITEKIATKYVLTPSIAQDYVNRYYPQ